MASECWKTGTRLNETRNKQEDIQVLLGALKVCSRTRNLEKGKQVHAEAVETGYVCDMYVANALINMYAKCGSMVGAREVFDGMEYPDVVPWTALILGYADNGQGDTALKLFNRMRNEGPAPDSVTLVATLKACTSFAVKADNRWADCKKRGKEIHNIAVENGCDSDIYVQNSLIDMYTKCGSMADAREVFNGMTCTDVVSWTALILGYVDNGEVHHALDTFAKMGSAGPAPNSVTIIAALKACTTLAAKGASRWEECKDRGKEIQTIAVENGCSSDVYLQNSLVDMYAKGGSMADARAVFDGMSEQTIVSWNALILGYADNGQGHHALDLLRRMRNEGFACNSITLLAALRACTSQAVKGGSGCREMVKEIHNLAVENGCNTSVKVQNSLVDMYGKCGSMVDALEVFSSMEHPTIVSWNAVILGYADNGQAHAALDMFIRMQLEGSAINSVTFLGVLKALSTLAGNGWTECKERGKEIHNVALEKGCYWDIYVQNSFVDMYVKCGSMTNAHEVFDCIKHPDVVSWTSLILGYAEYGQGETALCLFTRMRTEGAIPDSLTFGAALKACGLVGALEFGRTIHSDLGSRSGIHVLLVNCLVDFYAKCGSLVEAKMVFDVHIEARDVITWNALMAGFSTCGDNEIVFGLFEEMQDAGFVPDGITFLCLLMCCSHAGLVIKGKKYFDAMSAQYGIVSTVKHYNCMIDLFGRANKLDDAVALLEHMPCSPNVVTWMTILAACRKWKHVAIGRLAFQSLIDINDRDAGAYALMSQIYGSKGMLQEQWMVLVQKKKLKALKSSGESCWTNETGNVHTFLSWDSEHPQIDEIRRKWESMSVVMAKHGYTPSVTQDEEEICGHTERLALVCALINTQPGKTIRIVKSLRVCDDCHTALALISNLEHRTILCIDASRIHVFQTGKCSCGEFWKY